MAYFNHSFKKDFVGTKPSQSGQGKATIVDGILTDAGVHVSELKNRNAPYQLGPGVIGIFDPKTNLSLSSLGENCCPFYIASAALQLNDKIGPYHGGYQEANKSKIINPKFIREIYRVDGSRPYPAIVEIGNTINNNHIGAILTLDPVSLVPGTGYVDGVYAVTGGTGIGATIKITTGPGQILTATISDPGIGYTIGDTLTIVGGNDDGAIDVATVSASTDACEKEFLCGETYYLRIEVKGEAALRFGNHNLYHTFDASGGCCEDPANPVAIDQSVIYLQWATQIAENQILNPFIRPILVVDNVMYVYDAATAIALGLDPTTRLFANAPTTSTRAGLILMGAYISTTFGTCTFSVTDHYDLEPIQILASEVDLEGDPCTFNGVCVVEYCPGIQGIGYGEEKIRTVLLSESYRQNFRHTDPRIREITQGDSVFGVLTPSAIYSSLFILHSVPRFNNPTGTFDNDQYLLEIIGTSATIDAFLALLGEGMGGCVQCGELKDFSKIIECGYNAPNGEPEEEGN